MNALEDSIAHWERNAAAKTIKMGTDHCALCHVYYNNGPVNARTGQMYCVGSPYSAAQYAAEQLKDNPTPETWEAYRRAAHSIFSNP